MSVDYSNAVLKQIKRIEKSRRTPKRSANSCYARICENANGKMLDVAKSLNVPFKGRLNPESDKKLISYIRERKRAEKNKNKQSDGRDR